MKKQSNAEKIRWFIKDLLDDGLPHTAKEIKEYVRKRSGQNFTDGAFSGALRDLLAKDNSYKLESRGVYRFTCYDDIDRENEFEQLALNCIKILERAQQDMINEADKVHIMSTSNDTFNLIVDIKEISDALGRFSDEILVMHHDWLERTKK